MTCLFYLRCFTGLLILTFCGLIFLRVLFLGVKRASIYLILRVSHYSKRLTKQKLTKKNIAKLIPSQLRPPFPLKFLHYNLLIFVKFLIPN